MARSSFLSARPLLTAGVWLVALSPTQAQDTGAQAQILTPGAAAIGGTTNPNGLIEPGGGTVAPTSITTPGATGTDAIPGQAGVGSDGRTIHVPADDWVLSNPPVRTQVEGTGIAAFEGDANDLRGGTSPAPTPDPTTATATVTPTTDTTPVLDPNATPAQPDASEQASVQPATPEPTLDTTQVTAGATDTTTPSQPAGTQTDAGLGAVDTAAEFEMANLPFGPSETDLTADHIFRLEPVIALMRANPTIPLNVVAVISQADGDNEDVKLLARKRILAVRRHILSEGLSSDRLNFKITATAATEQYANHVLIQR